MLEAAQEVLAGEEAWVVGGALRDELLGRPLVDLDIACREPERAARRYARGSEGAPFPLSERHGAWRVALEDGRTVDFTPLPDGIHEDLATRDFTINAIARPLAGGEPLDPFGGLGDFLEQALRVCLLRLRGFQDRVTPGHPTKRRRCGVRNVVGFGDMGDDQPQLEPLRQAGRDLQRSLRVGRAVDAAND